MRKPICKIPLLLLILAAAAGLNAFDKQTVMMPMRDGVRLATDIYRPSVSIDRLPCILVRTPYGKKIGMEAWMLSLLTDILQYAVVLQDTRGRYGSEGVDSLYFSDGWGAVRDGYDSVEWLAARSWSNGRIGMFGASALGITGILAAGAAPPHLSCVVAIVTASNLYEDAVFYGGEYQHALVNGWLEETGNEDLIPFFRNHHDFGPVFDRVNLTTRFDSVRVPIFHIGGWHDIFIQGTLNAFTGLQASGGAGARGNQALLVGPWVHNILDENCGELSFPGSQASVFIDDIVNWFEVWLKDRSGRIPFPAVRYYLMGDAERAGGPGNRWISGSSWPSEPEAVPYYLSGGGRLATTPPRQDEPPDAFDFDPLDPVPTLGGRNLNIPAGSRDQRPAEGRPDVLVYETEILDDSVVVAGRVFVRLWASSDGPDTDFTAKLCDVYPDGRSMLVADGIVQARHRNSLTAEELLTPGEPERFTIDLWSTALVFAPGHRIRLDVSSSNWPRFSVNPNTGGPFGSDEPGRIARQNVYHDASRPSFLELPILRPTGIPEEPHRRFALGRNYPNPFNSSTVIPVFLDASTGRLELEIIDAFGRRLRSWRLPNSAAGQHLIRWDGLDESGRDAPSGVYVARLRSGRSVETVKIIRLR
ncbi:CocE/NonD family hydrolase [bacterium]|nr:CocE/NonD family hydrolase [bacterium]